MPFAEYDLGAGLGTICGSTAMVRYMYEFAELNDFLALPARPTVLEVGGGFGGMAYTWATVARFASYTIVDIPPVNQLISKVAAAVGGIPNLHFLGPEEQDRPVSSDLFLSIYSFNELDTLLQDCMQEAIDTIVAQIIRTDDMAEMDTVRNVMEYMLAHEWTSAHISCRSL